jgi:hypothetical protein
LPTGKNPIHPERSAGRHHGSQTPSLAQLSLQQSLSLAHPSFPLGMQPQLPSLAQ